MKKDSAAYRLIGPFRQIITFKDAPLKGPLDERQLGVIQAGAVVVCDGHVVAVGEMESLSSIYKAAAYEPVEGDKVLLPGFIDAHTHILFAGSRSKDYGMRLEGKTYLDIAHAGGGIMETVRSTRAADEPSLIKKLHLRLHKMLQSGITTAEVKTGYGLNVAEELRLLKILHDNRDTSVIQMVPTCLAAHMRPPDFKGDNRDYLTTIEQELFEVIAQQGLAKRVDIFVESSAFSAEEARSYLQAAKDKGWAVTVHADQFTPGGAQLAVKMGALSADHLEASREEDIRALAKSNTVATVLPGASLGLGIPFAPARKLLDQGATLAIASDWNPGSAPMGDLLTQAALLSVYQKLSMAETLAGITFRAAAALGLYDRGRIAENMIGDMQAYNTADYRDILYNQGALKPAIIWTKSKRYDQ